MFIVIIKLIMLEIVANIAFRPVHSLLATWAGYALILTSFALPCVAIRTPFRLNVKTSVFALIMLTLIMGASFISERSALSFDLIKSVLTFFCTYAAIAVEPQTFAKRDLKDILNINKILALVYVAYTFLPFSFRYTVANEWGGTAFTMSMGNQNATAISVLFCMVLLAGDAMYSPKRIIKVIDYAFIAALTYTVYLLESRTVLLCCIVVIVFPLVRKMRIRMVYVLLALLIPIAAIGLQFWLAEQETIIIFGKPLASGREQMYTEYIDVLLNDPLGYVLGKWAYHKLENYHNAPFALLMNFGIVGISLYYMFWTAELKGIVRQAVHSVMKTLMLIGILCFCVHSSSEAAPMLGSVLYGTEMAVICRLAKDNFSG